FSEPPRLLAQVQLVAGAGDQSGAVVAAILQPPQPFEENGRRLASAGEPDDPAHTSAPSGREPKTVADARHGGEGELRDQETGVRGQETGDRSQESGVRSQRS